MNSLATAVWDSEELQPLRKMLESEEEPPGGGIWKVSCHSGRSPYLVWMSSLGKDHGASSYTVLTFYDPERGAELSRACLLAAYRFTRAELRLVDQLLQGRTPAEAAEALGVTIHTVRTYLKRLYQKVGVKSQATLVRRLFQVSQAADPTVALANQTTT